MTLDYGTRTGIARVILVAIALSLFAWATRPGTAEATGDCQIRFAVYESYTVQNGWIFCYTGINTGDMNMEDPEPGMNLGPLHDGAYHSDFDTSTTSSGIKAAMIYEWVNGDFGEASYHRKICLYAGKNWTGTYLGWGGSWEGATTRTLLTTNPALMPGSFYWTTPNVACQGA